MPATERVTITLPADLLEEVDQLERNRSRFIAEAVQHEVTRRRRAALLASVRSPHPEATRLVDVGLADWTPGLPDDEGLLDPAGGIVVRWVEGEGWIKESAGRSNVALSSWSNSIQPWATSNEACDRALPLATPP